jgi:hypothetical protein
MKSPNAIPSSINIVLTSNNDDSTVRPLPQCSAEEIIQLARRHGIVLHHDSEIVGTLSRLPTLHHAPVEVFAAVSAFVNFVNTLATSPESPAPPASDKP